MLLMPAMRSRCELEDDAVGVVGTSAQARADVAIVVTADAAKGE